jgi:uncharacterized protein
MIVEDQTELIEFLSQPSAYSPPATRVDRIDTHAAAVFLAGPRAYKLKRAVRYDYLDFSTVDRRRRFCEAEVALNQPIAPSLYQGVTPVTRQPDGRLVIGGAGQVVDWLVVMRRFDDELLLDRVAERGHLDVGLMAPLARVIADWHGAAKPRPDKGGVEGMRWVVDGNEQAFRDDAGSILDAAASEQVIAASRRAIDCHGALLEHRRHTGWVRQCHGDLHLGNIVLLDGRPVPFDGVEFNDDISCVDVLYDLAFLLMDLWRRELRHHANELFNAYLLATGGTDESYRATALLPLFLSCRSAVRAKINATGSRLQPDRAHAQQLAQAASTYLDEAAVLIALTAPRLVAIGGLSGSGKSTLARHVAHLVGAAPGAVVLRSDVVRKQMAGVEETERLGDEHYTPEMNARVYDRLMSNAALIVRSGHSVIVDAVFARNEERRHVENVARTAGAAFCGIELEAPVETLKSRVARRSGDASDATADIVDLQAHRRHVARGQSGAWSVVDAAPPIDVVLTRLRMAIDRVL